MNFFLKNSGELIRLDNCLVSCTNGSANTADIWIWNKDIEKLYGHPLSYCSKCWTDICNRSNEDRSNLQYFTKEEVEAFCIMNS